MKSKLAIKLMAALGFGAVAASCDEIIPGTVAEYGCPNATYEIKGKVTDADSNPIKGIGINVALIQTYGERTDTVEMGVASKVATDAAGEYSLSTSAWPEQNGKLLVTATDTDGEENGGTFAAQSQTVQLTPDDFEGGSGSWYQGKVTKAVDFELENVD